MFPRLETRSLLLRPFTPRDAPKIHELSREDGIRKWIPTQVYRDEAHAASALAFLASQCGSGIDLKTSPCVLGIELKATGALVGHVGLSPLDGEIEVGFAVGRSQQGKGFATEAVRALCEWAAVKFPEIRIIGIAARENLGSQRVLERSGFQRQPEKTMFFQGSNQPVVVFTRIQG